MLRFNIELICFFNQKIYCANFVILLASVDFANDAPVFFYKKTIKRVILLLFTKLALI